MPTSYRRESETACLACGGEGQLENLHTNCVPGNEWATYDECPVCEGRGMVDVVYGRCAS